ncbi:MAG: class I mannose-6-phosphate isomerase [Chloroflexota bacterium]|nr:class I mannose-6-phosphate isomerase [Chloroflexota bacterium]
MADSVRYPLLTERRIVQPIWGGTRLAEWLDLPEPHPERIGETWQVYDTNLILNGPLAGRTLAEVTSEHGAPLVGTRTVEQYGADFPLLAKFIDAAQPLSIQVHPDDAYARQHEADTGFHGKTEAWYILDAEPGASVVYGLERPSSRAEFAVAVEDKTLESLLRRVPVHAGDVIFVPAGTIHAIDAGIMLFEIQQKSDLTYRVYDYGRRDARTGQPRELHLDKALDVGDLGPTPRMTIPTLPLSETRHLLIACPFFALERWALGGTEELTTDPGTFEIWTVIKGQGTLHWNDGRTALRRGDSVVLPAALGRYMLVPDLSNGNFHLLRAYVPNLERDLMTPLQQRGVDAARIAETVVLQ